MKQNKIENSNKIFDNNLPLTFTDVINDYIFKIHKELYEDALKKFESDRRLTNHDFELNNYKIIEIKNQKNFLKPSTIILFSKSEFKREKVDLTEYWNTNYTNENYISKFAELLIEDTDKKHIELEDIDYVKGKIRFRNKTNNKVFEVDKSKIDFNITYKNKLENTFGDLLKS